LFPGSNGDLSVKVTNPNAGPVTIKSVTGNSSITSSNPSGCSETNVAFPPQTGLSLGPIPAGGTMVITVPNSVHLDADAPTTCQGVLLDAFVEDVTSRRYMLNIRFDEEDDTE